jgi:hypothetical protein
MKSMLIDGKTEKLELIKADKGILGEAFYLKVHRKYYNGFWDLFWNIGKRRTFDICIDSKNVKKLKKFLGV